MNKVAKTKPNFVYNQISVERCLVESVICAAAKTPFEAGKTERERTELNEPQDDDVGLEWCDNEKLRSRSYSTFSYKRPKHGLYDFDKKSFYVNTKLGGAGDKFGDYLHANSLCLKETLHCRF